MYRRKIHKLGPEDPVLALALYRHQHLKAASVSMKATTYKEQQHVRVATFAYPLKLYGQLGEGS